VAEKVLPSVFFTELDAIIDTRMGTLMRIDPNRLEDYIKGGYFTRDRDVFKGVDQNKFQELYKNRDKLTLQASMMTPIVNYIRDFCQRTYEGNIKTPFLREPRIVVNLYPYQLTEDEKELLKKGLQIRTGKITKIEFVYMKYEDISPGYLKQETSVIAIYDPYEWLETHSKNNNLRKNSCPMVTMIGPLLIRNINDLTINALELQRYMEMLAKPFIDLELMVSKLFSANVSVNKPIKK